MEFPVGKMCKVFKVSRSAYYSWRRWKSSKRDNENRMLLSRIRQVHKMSKATYGSPRITKELNAQGFKVSRPRVARLMRQAKLRAVYSRKFIATTDSRHNYPVVENKLNRDFKAENKSQVWVSDITYVRTLSGWLYLTVIIDLFDRKVVGWSMSHTMKAEQTTIKAWRMAVKNRPPGEEMIFHSDRGIQYACNSFVNVLNQHKANIKRSMSRKGNCWDNAVAESYFKTIKTELVYRNSYRNKEDAAREIFYWIETWYNQNRRHSALGYLTINEFDKLKNSQMLAA